MLCLNYVSSLQKEYKGVFKSLFILKRGNMSKPIIQLKSITKGYKKNIVLKRINLDIFEGELFCIIGTNGSGKTTLLKLIVGFNKPDEGNIYYNNQDISKNLNIIKKDAGFATQENSFYPQLTVYENLMYFGNLYSIKKDILKKSTDNVLKLVQLFEHKKVLAMHLSVGMQRRLDIACALINNPKILILDEPTEDLDVVLRKQILWLIKAINKRGTTIIMTSHLMSEVEEVAERVAIIHNKSIIKIGTLDELKRTVKKSSLGEILEKIAGYN